MKPLHGLLRTWGFGVLAALGVVAWQFALRWLVPPSWSFALYALLCACAFPVAVAPSLRAAAVAVALSLPLSLGAALVAPDATTAVLCAALIAALSRAVLYRARPARALFVELALLGLGFSAARLLGGTGPFGLALGLWSYCLIQSLFFLLVTPEPRAAPALPGDPFDAAHQRALGLLESVAAGPSRGREQG
jgi:hypothetical protein